MECATITKLNSNRELAQFGSALRSGRRGHGFESRIPDGTKRARKRYNKAKIELFSFLRFMIRKRAYNRFGLTLV